MLSIVVSWRDRDELQQALPSLLNTAEEMQGDLTIVNFGGSDMELKRQLGAQASYLNVVTVLEETYFNKARAQNIGAHRTRQDVLFFCDCDIILCPGTIRSAVEQTSGATGLFVTLAGVRETEINSRKARNVVRFGYELNIKVASGAELRIVDSEEDANSGTRQAPGLLLVRRSDFLAVNGYNSRLHGWGWEDQDMIARLTLGRGLRREVCGYGLHISHDDQARVSRYPLVASRWESRDRMFRQALDNYDRGDFLGTYLNDINENIEPTLPLPVMEEQQRANTR